MIQVLINGKKAVTTVGSNVTVTFENPFLKDRDAWSMELPFPLNIPENIAIFGNLGRIDVSKHAMSFDNCTIHDNGRLIIKGVGRVTSATESEVRIQIKSGMQRIAYRSDFEKIYIDELTYDDADCAKVQDTTIPLQNRIMDAKGRWAFPLVYDEAQDRFLNVPTAWYIPKHPKEEDVKGEVADYYTLDSPAVQPSIKFVLSQVMGHMGYRMGYSYSEGDTDALHDVVGPRADLFIASNTDGLSVAGALPHWTVKRFLDEIRNLLNVTFIFDDNVGTVSIEHREAETQERVSYDCLDEFTLSFTEDGEQYIGASNLEYNLGESENSPICNDIKEDILKHFEIKTYDSRSAMMEAIGEMGWEESMKYVFRCPDGWYYTRAEDDYHQTVRVVFQHLRRSETDDTLTFNIAPVPLGLMEHPKTYLCQRIYSYQINEEYMEVIVGHSLDESQKWTVEIIDKTSSSGSGASYIPCISSDPHTKSSTTVQAAVEENESTEKDEDDRMEVMYLPSWPSIESFTHQSAMRTYFSFTMGTVLVDPAKPAAPVDLYVPVLQASTENMAFYRLSNGDPSIGDLHAEQRSMENRVMSTIRFITDDQPSPTKVHVFKNKLYLCDRIEINLTDQGVDRIKTGYFYEIAE